MPCPRCNSSSSCGCGMTAGPFMTVSGMGTPETPWVVGTFGVPPSLGLVFDGANGSTAPILSGTSYVICSPAGGGVPGAPSQALADFPLCPPTEFNDVYQTPTGLRGVPNKTSTVTTFLHTASAWADITEVVLNAIPINGFIDQTVAQVHTVTNNECWPMQYHVEINYHSDLAMRSPNLGVSMREETYLVINGAVGQRASHAEMIYDNLPGGQAGVHYDYDTFGSPVTALTLPGGGTQNLQVMRRYTRLGAAGVIDAAYVRGAYYDLAIFGIPV